MELAHRQRFSILATAACLVVASGCEKKAVVPEEDEEQQPPGEVRVEVSKEGIPPRPKNIILIGWDAADRRNIKEYLSKGMLPNLQELISDGSLVAIDALRFTDTKSGWAQILTGYEPEVTGVYNNKRYRPIPVGFTVFERLEAFFGPANIATVAVIGKKRHMDAEGPSEQKISKKEHSSLQSMAAKLQSKETIVEDQPLLPVTEIEGGEIYIKQPGKPYFHTQKGMDLFINGLMKDDIVGQNAIALLNQYKDQRFFFFVHFAEIDHNGHKHGEGSAQHKDAYRSADRWTGQILKLLEDLDLYTETLVYVTSDHGFMKAAKRHWDAPHVFLASNDKAIVRRGDRADIAATILLRFGMDLSTIEPRLDGHPLTEPYEPPIW